jgi:hypothetical protein
MTQAALARPPKGDHASYPSQPTTSLRVSSSTSRPAHGAPRVKIIGVLERLSSKSRTALQPLPTVLEMGGTQRILTPPHES